MTIKKSSFDIAQLLLRLMLGIGFLLPVMDRIGWFGPAGANGTSWGNWDNFIAYTHTLLPYMSSDGANFMGLIATAAEVILGVALIIGYQIRLASIGSFLLTLSFGLSMFFFEALRSPFNYSVFTASAASLLLSTIPTYRWSLDNRIR